MLNYIFTSGECKQPAHMYVSEVVDKFTKSSDKALQILNKWGITVSPSVLTEHKIHQAIIHIVNISKEIACGNAFGQASADNVNKRSKGARVRKSVEHRGWDATSVMAAQPKPKTIKLHPNEITIFFCNSNYSREDGRPYISYDVSQKGQMSLYISLVCILHRDLCHAKRDKSGLTLDEDLQLLEARIVSGLMQLVVTELNENVEYFIQPTAPKVKEFKDIIEHIKSGQQTLEVPEIITVIKLLKHPIHFYKCCDNQLSLVQSHHPKSLRNVQPLNLLLSNNKGEKYCMPLISAENFYNSHNLTSVINDKVDLSLLHVKNYLSNNELDYKELCDNFDQCTSKKGDKCLLKMSTGDAFEDENIALRDILFEDELATID